MTTLAMRRWATSITHDFINIALEPGARAGIELTLETAKELRAALDRVIAAAEFEEAEVRGKGAVPVSFGRRDAQDCVAELGGLEPAIKRL